MSVTVRRLLDASDLSDVSTKGIVNVPMSFETGEHTTTRVYFPCNVTVDKIRSIVMKAVEATNDGTITGANSTGPSASGVVTVAAGAALNEEDHAVPTDNNDVDADSYYQLTSSKATDGGKVLVGLEYSRR